MQNQNELVAKLPCHASNVESDPISYQFLSTNVEEYKNVITYLVGIGRRASVCRLRRNGEHICRV